MNTRSLSTYDIFEELLNETEGCRCDLILLCESSSPVKSEIWKSNRGHMFMGIGGYNQEPEVGVLRNKRRKRKVIKSEYVSGRMITTTLKYHLRRIVLTSVYIPHTDYTNVHIQKMSKLFRLRQNIPTLESVQRHLWHRIKLKHHPHHLHHTWHKILLTNNTSCSTNCRPDTSRINGH